MANSIDREDSDADDSDDNDSDDSDDTDFTQDERGQKMRRRKSAGDAPDNPPLATGRSYPSARHRFFPSTERTVLSIRTMPDIISPDNLTLRLSESVKLLGHSTSSQHSDQGNSLFSSQDLHASAPSPPGQPKIGAALSTLAINTLQLEISRSQSLMVSLLSRMDTLQKQRREINDKVLRTLRSYSASIKAPPADLLARLVILSQRLQGDYHSAEAQYEDLAGELQELETRRRTAETKLLELVHLCNPRRGQDFHSMAVPADTHTDTSSEEDEPVDICKERQDELLVDLLQDTSQTHAGEDEGGPSPGNVPGGLPDDPSLLGISGERYSDVHPFYLKLLHAIGDRQMTEEELSELSLEREMILEDLQTKILLERSRHGDLLMSEKDLANLKATLFDGPPAAVADEYASLLDEQDAAFLRQVDGSMQAARVQLGQRRQCVRTLYETCHAIGAMPRDMPYSEERAIFGRGGSGGGGGSGSGGGILDVHDDDGNGDGEDEDNDMDADPNESDDDLVDATMAGIPPQGTMDPQGLESPYFPLLLSSPKHLLQEKPVTAKVALEEALKEARKSSMDDLSGQLDITPDHPRNLTSLTSPTSPIHALQMEDRIKEYGISTMLTRFEEGNKVDFINRWLLQRLRITPLEVELLCSLFTMKLNVLNMMRWQADVLHFWTLDDGNQTVIQPTSASGSTSLASGPPARYLGVGG